MALVNPDRLRRILTKMLDENEFLSPYGIRSLSKFHEQHPFVLHVNGQEHRVDLPAGRVQHRHVRRQLQLAGTDLDAREHAHHPCAAELLFVLRDNFKIECPTGSGKLMNLFEVSNEISDRLTRIFLRDDHGRRPVYGGTKKFQQDPHWRDYISFYEYFHGDNGAGLGASHQTGWTGSSPVYAHVSADGRAGTRAWKKKWPHSSKQRRLRGRESQGRGSHDLTLTMLTFLAAG